MDGYTGEGVPKEPPHESKERGIEALVGSLFRLVKQTYESQRRFCIPVGTELSS